MHFQFFIDDRGCFEKEDNSFSLPTACLPVGRAGRGCSCEEPKRKGVWIVWFRCRGACLPSRKFGRQVLTHQFILIVPVRGDEHQVSQVVTTKDYRRNMTIKLFHTLPFFGFGFVILRRFHIPGILLHCDGGK